MYCISERCPAEVLKTNRGVFAWPEKEFGYTLQLECPYGLTSNITALASEKTGSPIRSPYYRYFDWDPRYKRSPVPLKGITLDKDKEYSSASGEAKTRRRIFLESQLRISNDGKAYAVRTCLLLNGTAVWGDVVDDLCKEEVSRIYDFMTSDFTLWVCIAVTESFTMLYYTRRHALQ